MQLSKTIASLPVVWLSLSFPFSNRDRTITWGLLRCSSATGRRNGGVRRELSIWSKFARQFLSGAIRGVFTTKGATAGPYTRKPASYQPPSRRKQHTICRVPGSEVTAVGDGPTPAPVTNSSDQNINRCLEYDIGNVLCSYSSAL